MARVIVAEPAQQDLAELIRTHSLPSSTRLRVRQSIEPLATFPRLGPALAGRWEGFRSILGPWSWMVIVYAHDDDQDLVIVVTIQDTRSGRSLMSLR